MTSQRWVSRACAVAVIGWGLLLAVPALAAAEDNGVGRTPAMGWSSGRVLGRHVDAAAVERQARAIVRSGLRSVGYRYIDLGDDWYACPGSEGPNVGEYGRWSVDRARFPDRGGVNGIQALARYLHRLHLKLGIYVTPGISKQAVARNTQIKGSRYTADQIATTTPEPNYDCGGMVAIDHSAPGAQAFIDSRADRFARWGVDSVTLDGVGPSDVAEIRAWSQALRQSGRRISLGLSHGLDLAGASTWAKYANSWLIGPGDQCPCSSMGAPFADWFMTEDRFAEVAGWGSAGRAGAFNDYGPIDVGAGSDDGLTADERQTQLSLWALGASPLILGTNITKINRVDRDDLLNRAVIAVDQDGIDARRIAEGPTKQVFAKADQGGTVVGLFNTGAADEPISTTLAAVGLTDGQKYAVSNLWGGATTNTGGTIIETVPPRGVALLRIAPAAKKDRFPPLTGVQVRGPAQLRPGRTVTEDVVFTNGGRRPVRKLKVALEGSDGLRVSAAGVRFFRSVEPGQTVSAPYRVTARPTDVPMSVRPVVAHLSYNAVNQKRRKASTASLTVHGGPVSSRFRIYSAAGYPAAEFSEVGSELGIQAAGAVLSTRGGAYSAIYRHRAAGSSATVTTQLLGGPALAGGGEVGIMLQNNIADPGNGAAGVVLCDSRDGGIQLRFAGEAGGQQIDTAVPHPHGHRPPWPLFLRLVRKGDTYTGYYSEGGNHWQPVGHATVAGQASAQDAGVFVSLVSNKPDNAIFKGFSVS